MSQLHHHHHHITSSSHSINAIGHMLQLHPCRVVGCHQLTWVFFPFAAVTGGAAAAGACKKEERHGATCQPCSGKTIIE
jgi:hypothetical protein